MIPNFKDHAANERTYLAWIRTAIAIMAFGFLVEKFDIFISYIGHVVGSVTRFKPSISVEYIGLGLMLVSVIIIIGSTIRFFHYEKTIESETQYQFKAKWPNLILASIMLLFAGFLVVYMLLQVIKG